MSSKSDIVSMHDLVRLEVDDYKEIGVSLGKRKRIIAALEERKKRLAAPPSPHRRTALTTSQSVHCDSTPGTSVLKSAAKVHGAQGGITQAKNGKANKGMSLAMAGWLYKSSTKSSTTTATSTAVSAVATPVAAGGAATRDDSCDEHLTLDEMFFSSSACCIHRWRQFHGTHCQPYVSLDTIIELFVNAPAKAVTHRGNGSVELSARLRKMVAMFSYDSVAQRGDSSKLVERGVAGTLQLLTSSTPNWLRSEKINRFPQIHANWHLRN